MSRTMVTGPTGRSQAPALISSLCDIVVNKKRSKDDFLRLLQCLEEMPKECAPFKGKILQHLELHGLKNSTADVILLSMCFAKATILVKKTANKDEGPVGAWKVGLLNELRTLEENLNQLYSTVGISTSYIIEREEHDKPSKDANAWEDIINDHLLKINLAAHNVCALISVQTDFDLPIPVSILLKIAAKISLIRLQNHLKKPSSSIKAKCYSLYPHLIDINLMLFRTLVQVLGSNIIPFTSFIIQSLVKTLEWTRTGNLIKAGDIQEYHLIRSNVFKTLTMMMEQLSLNVNMDPRQLKTLVEVEILDNLEELFASPRSPADLTTTTTRTTTMADAQVVAALVYLEHVLIAYHDLLDPKLESKVKSFIVQTCVKIYRDFDSNLISLTCRRQLLQVLLTIANQPYATSTTEIACHLFELVERLERDSVMRSEARKALNVGLSHRPTIVTQHDIYNCYGLPMPMTVSDTAAESAVAPTLAQEKVSEPPAGTSMSLQTTEKDDSGSTNGTIDVEQNDTSKEEEVVEVDEEEEEAGDAMANNDSLDCDDHDDDEELEVVEVVNGRKAAARLDESDCAMPVDESQVESRSSSKLAQSPAKAAAADAGRAGGVEREQPEQDESEILLYMSDFVEKLA